MTPTNNTPPTQPDSQQSADEGVDGAVCSTSFEIFELRDFAFRALPKKELVRLLTHVGEPPLKSKDRQRDLMALRLARYADAVTITVQWDCRMPNAKHTNPKPTTTDANQ